MRRIKDPFAVNLLAQVAGVAALGDRANMRQSVEANNSGKLQPAAGLEALGLRALPTRANFVLIDLGQPAQAVYQALLQQGVIVRPCASFGLSNHIRVTIGLEAQNERLLQALGRALA